MAEENLGLDLASQTGQEDIVKAIKGLTSLLSRSSNILTLGKKTATQNGVFDPSDDGVDGYDEFTVNLQMYTNDVSEGTPVYKPTSFGLITPPNGYAGFGDLLIDQSGSSDIFPNANLVSQHYEGNFTTYTFQKEGNYAVVVALDGYTSSTLSYTTTATVIKEKASEDKPGTYGCMTLFLIVSADVGDTITISGTSVSRQKMIVTYLTDRTTNFTEIVETISKDDGYDTTITIDNVSSNYIFCFAGTTADYNPVVTITSTNDEKFSIVNSTNKLHKTVIFESGDQITLVASGTSYACNYCGYFGFDA